MRHACRSISPAGPSHRLQSWARARTEQAPRADRRSLRLRRDGRAGPVARPARWAHAGAQATALSDRLRGARQRHRLPAAVACGGDPSAQPPHRRLWSTSGRDPDGTRAFPTAEELAAVRARRAQTPSASARPRLARSSKPPARSSPAISTWRRLEHARRCRACDRAPDQPARRSVAGPRSTCCCAASAGCTSFPETMSAHTTSSGASSTSTRALDYDTVKRLVARWHPYAGVVYFHLLLDSLARPVSSPRLKPSRWGDGSGAMGLRLHGRRNAAPAGFVSHRDETPRPCTSPPRGAVWSIRTKGHTMNAALGRRLLAEFVGTALLVIFGAGARRRGAGDGPGPARLRGARASSRSRSRW